MNRKYRVVESDEDGNYLPAIPFEVPMGSPVEMVVIAGLSALLNADQDRDPSLAFSWHIEHENGRLIRPDTSLVRQMVENLCQSLRGN